MDRTADVNLQTIVMQYYGNVGGLRVMHSTLDRPFLNSSALGTRLCDAGNTGAVTGWRNPTLAELAMLMTPTGGGRLAVTISVGRFATDGIPGARSARENTPSVVMATFYAAVNDFGQNGLVADLTPEDPADIFDDHLSVISGLVDSGGYGLALRMEQVREAGAAGEVGVLSPDVNAVGVCVQELAGYNGGANPQFGGGFV